MYKGIITWIILVFILVLLQGINLGTSSSRHEILYNINILNDALVTIQQSDDAENETVIDDIDNEDSENTSIMIEDIDAQNDIFGISENFNDIKEFLKSDSGEEFLASLNGDFVITLLTTSIINLISVIVFIVLLVKSYKFAQVVCRAFHLKSSLAIETIVFHPIFMIILGWNPNVKYSIGKKKKPLLKSQINNNN